VKYLPYPPLRRIEFACDSCSVTAAVFSHYPEACTAQAAHRCRRTMRVKELTRR
jgi:hypothetical protein